MAHNRPTGATSARAAALLAAGRGVRVELPDVRRGDELGRDINPGWRHHTSQRVKEDLHEVRTVALREVGDGDHVVVIACDRHAGGWVRTLTAEVDVLPSTTGASGLPG